MTNDCNDRDLLAIEPAIFTGGAFESQRLAAGTGATINGTTFTSDSADFVAANVEPGMVLCIYSAVPTEASSYEIVTVNSSTSLTISVLRPDRQGPIVAPPSGVALSYYLNTFSPQIAGARQALQEKLRQIGEVTGIDSAEFVDSSQFRYAVAMAALAQIFTARASNATNADANWVKAEFYRRQHASAVASLRLAKDADGDGVAEHTRTLGNVTLRRT